MSVTSWVGIDPADRRAWNRRTIDDPAGWYATLSPSTLDLLEHEALRACGADAPLATLQPSEELLAILTAELSGVVDALEVGRGFAVVRSLDPDRFGADAAPYAYWLLGHGVGRPIVQNVQGTLLYDVRDTGTDLYSGARVSITNRESGFHTDNSFGDRILDYVGLHCLRSAREGGLSQVVSGFSAARLLARENPEALDSLAEAYAVDRRAGTRPGQASTVDVPVLSAPEGELLVRYLRYWIQAAEEKRGEPLPPSRTAALDILDATLNRPDLRAEFMLEPGEVMFLNNRWLLHNRTGFEDFEEPEKKRHYVRLWLQRHSRSEAALFD